MRIGFNARFMVDPSRRGFNRYTYSLAKALAAIDGVEIWLISEDPIHESFLRDLPARTLNVKAFKTVWWEQAVLPRVIGRLGLDVFHAPASLGLPLRRVCPYVLTIHDVIGRAARELVAAGSLKARVYNRVFQRVCLRSARRLITVSEHSKRDICRYLGVPPDRIDVIYQAADERFRPIDDPGLLTPHLRRYGLERPYLLYVGGFDRRKNIRALVGAYARARVQREADLVLAGAKTEEYSALAEETERLGVGERVRFLGYVDDDDLPFLYNGATAFVYPSLFEGFGLQSVEAMACGVPVLASNRTALPEILNGAGVLFDPEDIDAIRDAVDHVFFDNELRGRLRRQSLKGRERFSWARTAARTFELYRAALSDAGRLSQ